MRRRRWRLPAGRKRGAWLLLAFLVSGCSERGGHDPFALMEGQGIYQAECASCHGAQLQGQPEWQTRRPDGKLPAPPHDASGHTWHHPREQLAAIVKQGMVPPQAPPGYVSDMPAFAGKLTDAQIDNVLAWIESQWPPDVQQHRQQMLKRP